MVDGIIGYHYIKYKLMLFFPWIIPSIYLHIHTSKVMVAFIPQIQFFPTDIREAKPTEMINISNARITCVDNVSLDKHKEGSEYHLTALYVRPISPSQLHSSSKERFQPMAPSAMHIFQQS